VFRLKKNRAEDIPDIPRRWKRSWKDMGATKIIKLWKE
jgi:hypothetical protein